MSNKVYLGDAVYARFSDCGDLILTTENGIEASNTIYLEAEVLDNLLLYLEKIKVRK